MEEMSNHLARALTETLARQSGNEKSIIAPLTKDQSKRAQCGVGGGGMMAGGCRVMTIGT